MKIEHDRLLNLRKGKRLSRRHLADRSGISARTIQRLENEPERCQNTREDTVNLLAKALDVEPGVLKGELPLPESDKAPEADPDPIQIGAQIPPKVRLAYDLIKRRYGVNATDIITMAPLFFVLLAEGSLAHRRKELHEANSHFEQIASGHGVFVSALVVADMNGGAEHNSIHENDLFGEHLLDDSGGMTDQAFDPTENNPFASYLYKLAAELAIPGVVDLDKGDLSFGSPAEFPDYNLCMMRSNA